MSKKTIYKITVTKWAEHNKGHKATYKKFMIRANFCTDAKIRTLSMTERWLFLNLIVACSDIAMDTVELSQKHIRDILECRRNIDSVLDRFVELQLVTYEKMVPNELKELKELKEKNTKRPHKIKSARQVESDQEIFQDLEPDANASPPVESNIGKKLIGVYCENWKTRYKSNPPIRPQDAKSLKQLGESNGFDRTKKLIEAYLRMNERFYLQKRHDLATFMNNLTSVAHFIETGRVITGQDLRNVDRAIANKNTLDALEKGEI